ncbi:MAG: hypothetical protein AB7D00_10315 [Rhodospirillaceae bacterium]
MKRAWVVAVAALAVAGCQAGGYKPVAEKLPVLKVSFADPAWDGKTVPKGQECSAYGGTAPKSPALRVAGLPEGTNAVIVEFNDHDAMDFSTDGGHGKIGYWVDGAPTAVLPGVPAAVASLPAPAFVEAGNRATGTFAAPGYLPPCSGGAGNRYFAIVKAVHKAKGKGEENALLAEGMIELGKY